MQPGVSYILAGRYRSHRAVTTLWHLFSGDRLALLASMGLHLIKHSPIWLWPIFLKRITEGVEIGGWDGFHRIWVNSLIMGLIFAQNIPSHMAFMALFSRANRNMEARLRGALIRRLQQLSIAFHDRTQTGRLQAKVLRDVERVQMLTHRLMNSLWPGIISLIVPMTYTLYREPLMALFFGVAGPLGVGLKRLFTSHIRQRNREFRSNVEDMSGKVGEMIDMIPISRAHAVEEKEIQRIDSKLQEVRQRGIRLDLINALFGCANWVSFNLLRLLCLLTTCYIALRWPGRMSLSDVIMYQGFFEVILRGLTQVISAYPVIATGFESIHSIGEVLECPDLEHNQGKKSIEKVAGAFAFQNVYFRYQNAEQWALEAVNLTVQPGESIALVGESGAGKSTMVNLLVGFHRPSRGSLLLDGHDMEQLDLRSYRRHLAVVPQESMLFSGSIRDNIAFGIEGLSDEQIYRALSQANALEFVEDMPEGIHTPIGEHGKSLSGGQKQRIAVARAIVRDPRVIIFDEATSALDVVSEKLVQEAIDRLIQDRTTFIVAHRLSTIRRCDRIVVMRQGRIIEVGSEEDLMQRQGEYHRLRSLQV
jgi:ATP-binding cassette subfamily B protein